LPSLSLQAQVTPALQPSALHTTNHLVLITGIFSPFVPPQPLLPSLHALLYWAGTDLPHCPHPSVHPISVPLGVLSAPPLSLSLSLAAFTTSRLCLFLRLPTASSLFHL
uniref:Uncharacterized protein n=1 Tax=Sparus aurata TaxID=8175 RepID=A0A671VBQ7_SPAAU